MRTQIVLTSAFLVVATFGPVLAQDQSPEAAETDATVASTVADQPLSAMPSYQEPVVAWDTVDDALPDAAICRDQIYRAHAADRLPPLDRDTADQDKPLRFYAVDRREGGCSMLETMGDARDIRPNPLPDNGPPLRPAAGQ